MVDGYFGEIVVRTYLPQRTRENAEKIFFYAGSQDGGENRPQMTQIA